MTKDLGVVGIVARFKPVHKGHAAILETLCERATHVYIGLGSCNRKNARNPFTAQESAEMVDLILKPNYSNYSFVEIIDFDNGPLWRENVLKVFGKLDCFVCANDYVVSLLNKDYKIIHPLTLIPEELCVRVNATMVRVAMAKCEHWEHLVPELVAKYIVDQGLDARFRAEFGLETIARHASDILLGEVTW